MKANSNKGINTIQIPVNYSCTVKGRKCLALYKAVINPFHTAASFCHWVCEEKPETVY